ncbi:MAG: oligosaccharide flippase family protein, partial [Planctomycetota bacterium]
MSFAKHSIQTILVRVFLVLLGLVAGVINARWLGPEGVGIIALLLLVKNFAFRFGNLGFGSAFAFYVAKEKSSIHQILEVIWLTGSIASFMGIIILLFVWRRSFSPWNDIEPKLFYFYLLAVPLFFFNNYIQRVLSGELRITEMNFANMITIACTVLFTAALVIVFKMGIIGAILSVLLADLLTFFYLLFRVRKGGKRTVESDGFTGGKKALIYSLWRYGRWNYLLMFTGFLGEEIPLILLKSFSANNAPVGIYSKARNLGRQFRMVALPISQVLFPYTAASKEDYATKRTNILCRNSLVLMVLAAATMALLIKPIIFI